MSWLFGLPNQRKQWEGSNKKMDASEGKPVKTPRPVVYYRQYSMNAYLDEAIGVALKNADIMSDADKVIECLKASPLFQKLVCEKAQRDLDSLKAKCEAAEARVKEVCYIGDKP